MHILVIGKDTLEHPIQSSNEKESHREFSHRLSSLSRVWESGLVLDIDDGLEELWSELKRVNYLEYSISC